MRGSAACGLLYSDDERNSMNWPEAIVWVSAILAGGAVSCTFLWVSLKD